MGVCNCSMFCCTLLYVTSSLAIILMGKRELVALLSLSSWCLWIVVWLFLAVTWVNQQFVIVVFPDHTHLLYLGKAINEKLQDLILICIFLLGTGNKNELVACKIEGNLNKNCGKEIERIAFMSNSIDRENGNDLNDHYRPNDRGRHTDSH